jgi:hypothetical protein
VNGMSPSPPPPQATAMASSAAHADIRSLVDRVEDVAPVAGPIDCFTPEDSKASLFSGASRNARH